MRPLVSHLLRPLLILLGSLSLGWCSLSLIAQQPPQKPPVEEEDTAQPRPKKEVHVEEEEKDNKRPSQSPPPALAEFQQYAEQTSDPALQKLYRELAVPHDVIIWSDHHQSTADPIATYIANPPNQSESVNLRLYDDKGHLGQMHTTPLRDIDHIDYYEDIALQQVNALLGQNGSSDAAKIDRLRVAETVLSAVLRYSEATRQPGPGSGAGWKEIDRRLRQRVVSVQLDQVKALATADDWLKAVDLVNRLSRSYANDQAVQEQLAQQIGRLVQQSLAKGNYIDATQRLRTLHDQFPTSPVASQLEKELSRQAAALKEDAQHKEQQGDHEGALKRAILAETIAPTLPGVRDYVLRLQNAYPAPLGVGVHEVPVFLSPATAVTDSEKQTVELLFESLVKVHYSREIGQSYDPDLTVGRPHVIPLGRKFALARNARWSNGEPLTAADIRATVQLLRHPDWDGFAPDWATLMQDPLPSQNPFEISLRLRQGIFEPLSFMTFKILPAARNLGRPDDPEFAQHPLGSGPFQFRETKDGEAVFTANPHYQRPQGPSIREIRFFHSEDPPRDFQAGRLHLLLDLPTDVVPAVSSLNNVTVKTYRNRRIYFLAVNHREPLLQSVHLRKAIGHAINREQILTDVFRDTFKEKGDELHRPLNGPYPPGTWAYNPSPHMKADPYDQWLARARAAEVHKSTAQVHLTLKFPDDNRGRASPIRRACEAIRDQLKDLNIGIELELLPLPPRQFHEEVEVNHQYELAYCHYDYPDELYWLWPLFNPDPQAVDRRGGGNYLGYRNDSRLESDFQAAMNHRDFTVIKQFTYSIHERIYDVMPFIPLWQLDSHIAYKDITIPDPDNVDPLRVFTDVEQWKKANRND